ncbi:MAG: hypothetical protein ACXVMS_07750 [Flavisolibacter sp.]
MIQPQELRPGNYVLHKTGVRILPVLCTLQHFEKLARGEEKDFFPLVLKADILEKCGFVENRNYPLLPEAREFRLVLPVIGSGQNEMVAYIKNNKECFGRAMLNGLPISNNFYQLHQLQNLYFALTGEELKVRL